MQAGPTHAVLRPAGDRGHRLWPRACGVSWAMAGRREAVGPPPLEETEAASPSILSACLVFFLESARILSWTMAAFLLSAAWSLGRGNLGFIPINPAEAVSGGLGSCLESPTGGPHRKLTVPRPLDNEEYDTRDLCVLLLRITREKPK